MRTTILIFFLLLFIGSCGDQIAPSDAQIYTVQQQVDTLPIGTPAHAQAVAQLEALKQQRATADATIQATSSVVNTVVPGLGALLALGYGMWQRVRGDKKATALTATMAGIEDFRKVGGDESVEKLVELLATAQDRAGVRTAIRQALAELKAPDAKVL